MENLTETLVQYVQMLTPDQPQQTFLSYWPVVLPFVAVMVFLVPLINAYFVAKLLDEKFLINKKTATASIERHGLSAVVITPVAYYFLYWLLDADRMERAAQLSTGNCVMRWLVYFFLADFLFYVVHRFLHLEGVYQFAHACHHEYKAVAGARLTLNTLAANCVSPTEIILEGVVPVMLPSLVVPMPIAYVYGYMLFHNFWLSCVHSTGSRANKVPSFFGIMVTPKLHCTHHNGGVTSSNFSAHLTLWDRLLGTYEG